VKEIKTLEKNCVQCTVILRSCRR